VCTFRSYLATFPFPERASQRYNEHKQWLNNNLRNVISVRLSFPSLLVTAPKDKESTWMKSMFESSERQEERNINERDNEKQRELHVIDSKKCWNSCQIAKRICPKTICLFVYILLRHDNTDRNSLWQVRNWHLQRNRPRVQNILLLTCVRIPVVWSRFVWLLVEEFVPGTDVEWERKQLWLVTRLWLGDAELLSYF